MRQVRWLLIIVLIGSAVLGITRLAKALGQAEQAPKPSHQEEVSGIASFNRSDLDLDRGDVVVYGTLSMRLFIDLTEEDIREISSESPGFFNRIGLIGWQREGTRFYRIVPAKDLAVHFDGETVHVKDGKFAFLAEKEHAGGKRQALRSFFENNAEEAGNGKLTGDEPGFPFSLSIKGVRIPSNYIEVSTVDLGLDESFGARVDIIENINFSELKSGMCHLESKSSAGAGEASAPMDNTCLDYNGPLTNGKNLPKTDKQAWVNFICSDCDVSFLCASCWNDHLVGGCKKNHGKLCSVHIGHSTSYHKHKWTNCVARCRR